jgi:hypothetical protein
LAQIDKRIEQILSECEARDQQEEESGSLVQMERELADQARLKEKVQKILEELREEGKTSTNTTDPDCTRIRGRQGSHAGYFLLRGLEGVRAEMSLLAACFNIARLMTILGVTGLIARLGQ